MDPMNHYGTPPIPARVLILTAELGRARYLRTLLLRRHFAVSVVLIDQADRAFADRDGSDVILLDLAGEAEDGLSLCRRLRTAGVASPILMLRPQGTLEDLLDGFEAGADAYLCGLIDDAELLSRIGALCRRSAMDSTHCHIPVMSRSQTPHRRHLC